MGIYVSAENVTDKQSSFNVVEVIAIFEIDLFYIHILLS